MKAAAISKTSDGKEIVVAIFQADTREGIADIASRWLSCSGRLADLDPIDDTTSAQLKLERGEL